MKRVWILALVAAVGTAAAGDLTIKAANYAVVGYIGVDGAVKDASYRVLGYVDPSSGAVKDASYRVLGYVEGGAIKTSSYAVVGYYEPAENVAARDPRLAAYLFFFSEMLQ